MHQTEASRLSPRFLAQSGDDVRELSQVCKN